MREIDQRDCQYGQADSEHIKYWLCCGSTVYPHGAESCYEAKHGHPERVRFGTAKEHSEWSKGKA